MTNVWLCGLSVGHLCSADVVFFFYSSMAVLVRVQVRVSLAGFLLMFTEGQDCLQTLQVTRPSTAFQHC